MNIRGGNFDLFLKVLEQFYVREKCYLTDKVKINWVNLRKLFGYLKAYERMIIETSIKDFKTYIQTYR